MNKLKGKKDLIMVGGIYVLALISALFMVFKLYMTTVADYDTYARAASNDQWKLLTYTSERGVIYDANYNQLASNTYNYTVVISPNIVMRSDNINRSELIETLSTMLDLDVTYLDTVLPLDPSADDDPRNQVAGMDLCRNVEVDVKEDLQAYLDSHDIDGIGFVAMPQRYYNYGSLAAQVIGYASNDGVSLRGVYGLEAYYNSVLSGTNGYRYSEVDSATDGVLPYSEATTIDPVDGNNLVLNIDMNIQRIAEEAARGAYMQYSPRGGITIIVMDPYTAAVLAMVSMPDYDLNDPYGVPYGLAIDPLDWDPLNDEEQREYLMGSVWRNRAISDTYEPGSTFKALTTAIALEENLTNEDEMFSDEPIQVSEIDTISCWLQKSANYNHGIESLTDAFQNSCNPIFVQLARRIGVDRYYSYVHTFGFYDITGIDLPAEGTGVFHTDPSWVDMACLSFGESATVTPIQLLNAYCAIINGGNLMVPHIVHYITDQDNNIVDEIEPEVVRTIFSEQTCTRVRALLEAVVRDGTGTAGQVPGYSVAGKTSTSTIENGEEAGMHVLSFSCYAPSNDPRIAVLAIINRPEDRSVGSSSAAALAARVVEGTLTYLGVPRVFTAEEYDKMVIRYYVQPVSGLPASEASSTIGRNGISTIYGTTDMNSETIVGFTYPGTDAMLYSTGIVVLYPTTVSEADMLTTTVPNLSGKSAMECIEALRDMNLNCVIDGDIMGVCTVQSEDAGSEVFAGTIVRVTLEAGVEVDETEETEETEIFEDGYIPEDDTDVSDETAEDVAEG